MAQLTVELDDREIARVRAAARARQVDSNHLTSVELLQALAAAYPKKAKAKGVWLSGSAARMTRMRGTKGIDALLLAYAAQCATEMLERQHQAALAKMAEAVKETGVAADTAAISAAARAKRLAAVMSVHGMWKHDPDKPRDAVAYQREARAEWK
ncbi:hypothetical protein RugamoR57_27180 [Duganella caerulea]|uniref:hypothetical protein n=1 Tax=Duganella caerulea TaxID=2885762 RepID=UPI0030E9A3EF